MTSGDPLKMPGFDVSPDLVGLESERTNDGKLVVIRDRISYDEFFTEHMVRNVPCLFSGDFTCGWPSRTDWVQRDGKPCFDKLDDMFGAVTVPVADCNQKYYNAQEKKDWVLHDYLDYWRKYVARGYSSGESLLYLKDWHFRRDCPYYEAYITPVYFASDWLNEYWAVKNQEERDDYQFVYMGPKGTWTPLHADVFSSFSWSANVSGRKKWVLFPPGSEESLKDSLGNLAYDVGSGSKKTADQIEVIQGPGEIIFVPSCWHHQVWNLEDTISINHNWFNGTNIDVIWASLKAALHKVKAEVDDCRDMEGWDKQCQAILCGIHGMDYEEFFNMLECIVTSRLKQNQKCTAFGWELGPNHVKYDLSRAKNIMLQLEKDDDFSALYEGTAVHSRLEEITHQITTSGK